MTSLSIGKGEENNILLKKITKILFLLRNCKKVQKKAKKRKKQGMENREFMLKK